MTPKKLGGAIELREVKIKYSKISVKSLEKVSYDWSFEKDETTKQDEQIQSTTTLLNKSHDRLGRSVEMDLHPNYFFFCLPFPILNMRSYCFFRTLKLSSKPPIGQEEHL